MGCVGCISVQAGSGIAQAGILIRQCVAGEGLSWVRVANEMIYDWEGEPVLTANFLRWALFMMSMG